MRKSIVTIYAILVILSLTALVNAEFYQWIDVSGDHLWNNSSNWDGPEGTFPDGSGHIVNIKNPSDNYGSVGHCLFTEGMNYSVSEVRVNGTESDGLAELNISGGILSSDEFIISVLGADGKVTISDGELINDILRIGLENNDSNASLIMNGGSITNITDSFIGQSVGSSGTLEINGGTLTSDTEGIGTRLLVGANGGSGTLIMSDGVINVKNFLVAFNNNSGYSSTGRVYLNGGTINVSDTMFINTNGSGNANGDSDGLIDVAGGKIVFTWDEDRTWYAGNLEAAGLMTAYGGDGQLISYQQEGTGYTVIEAEAPASDVYSWNDNGLNHLWDTPQNWQPVGTPNGTDIVANILDGGGIGSTEECLLTNGDYTLKRVKVQVNGYEGLAELNVNGGLLSIVEDLTVSEYGGDGKVTISGGEVINNKLFVGYSNNGSDAKFVLTSGSITNVTDSFVGFSSNSKARMDVSGGTFTSDTENMGTRLVIGHNGGDGTLVVTGGVLDIKRLHVATNDGSTGRVYLNGGIMNISQELFINTTGVGNGTGNSDGLIDIAGGKLVLMWNPGTDLTDHITNNLINQGYLKSYGGWGYFDIYLDANGYTVVEALDNPPVDNSYVWTGEGPGGLWDTPQNWRPGGIPNGTDIVANVVSGGGLGQTGTCILAEGMNYDLRRLKVQTDVYDDIAELNITGGSFSIVEDFVISEFGGDANVNMSGGVITDKRLRVGYQNNDSNALLVMDGGEITSSLEAIVAQGDNSPNSAAGTLDINGGTFSTNSGGTRVVIGLNGGYGELVMNGGVLNAYNLYVATNADSTGRVYLNGGTINVSNSLFFNTNGTGGGNNAVGSADGVMDVAGGKLVLTWDPSPQEDLTWYADNLEAAGLITAYNGNGEIISYKDTDTGYTVIEAYHLDGDFNNDDYVDIEDIGILADNWLESGDNMCNINGDDIVNFSDFSLMTENYLLSRTYYVSSLLGDNGNTGTSEYDPWQTLGKISAQTLRPGDKVYFKRGDTWTGQRLVIDTSGTENNPIVIDAYDTGDLPHFTDHDNPVVAQESSYLSIRNIKVSNALQGINPNIA